MAEQQLKEAVIAYTLLYMNIEDELSQEQLDGLCERFLEEHFGLKVGWGCVCVWLFGWSGRD